MPRSVKLHPFIAGAALLLIASPALAAGVERPPLAVVFSPIAVEV